MYDIFYVVISSAPSAIVDENTPEKIDDPNDIDLTIKSPRKNKSKKADSVEQHIQVSF